ncbi:LacI family DNA-binding transcriptional regulator [Paenibacillus qinlingensis]|uniref:LacI family DNA-binding transcriptional regulator n=1 Tax=Paenibacillus qinlingensis TaxID=1837343 RepID=UPI0015662BFB|nr:LacI family DNA-binding transcriptional regulator [Paenibacillus qinlingensis]NQX61621.1 LacI family DNA-binding transcriptional regulator [Paenibacillus qinlingensis]
MASRQEVAERAGVSVAVVSYVLNGKNNVKMETRERVLAAMKELGYEPNLLARSLKTKKTGQLAVLVNYLGNPFEAGLLLHIESAAREEAFLVFFQSYTPDTEEQLISSLRGRVDGIILLGQELMAATYDRILEWEVPILSVTQSPNAQDRGIPYMDVDWSVLYKQAIQHLKDNGHTSIGYMTDTESSSYHVKRLQYFQQAMLAEGLELQEKALLSGGGRLENASEDFQKFVDKHPSGLPFSAIICTNDLMAAGILDVCKKNGIQIPEQLAILGSENILMTTLTEPQLSVIHYPRDEVGRLAMEMMKELMEKRPVAARTLTGHLVIRGSS